MSTHNISFHGEIFEAALFEAVESILSDHKHQCG